MYERPAVSCDGVPCQASEPRSENRADESPEITTSCEPAEAGEWHEAGPAAGLVARRWALQVLRVLDQRGPTRFNDLRRETGAGGQPLKATLEALARAGLVSRHVISTAPPPSVIYRLTPAARDLFPVLSSLAKWHQANEVNFPGPPADLPRETAEVRS